MDFKQNVWHACRMNGQIKAACLVNIDAKIALSFEAKYWTKDFDGNGLAMSVRKRVLITSNALPNDYLLISYLRYEFIECWAQSIIFFSSGDGIPLSLCFSRASFVCLCGRPAGFAPLNTCIVCMYDCRRSYWIAAGWCAVRLLFEMFSIWNAPFCIFGILVRMQCDAIEWACVCVLCLQF